MKKITVNKTRILTAAAALVAVFSLAGCGSTAVKEVPQPAETSRSEEATLETAAPEATATPAPTPDVVVPTSVTLEQEGGILNNGMTWTLHATVLPEDAADKTITWTSADESVATIDDSGVITTHALGQTTITAASTAGGVSTTYNLVVQEVVKCSYCGGTGHTADTCAVKKTAEQQAAAVIAQQQAAAQAAEQAAAQAAEQPAAEAAQPADPGYEVDWAGRRIYYQGDADIPEGGVVQRPDGSRYIKGPRCVIFGYDTCPEDTDPSLPGNTPFTGDCVFCGDFGHDVYHCPILDELESSEAYQELLQNNG
jgi:predicted small lipoprotein YifL